MVRNGSWDICVPKWQIWHGNGIFFLVTIEIDRIDGRCVYAVHMSVYDCMRLLINHIHLKCLVLSRSPLLLPSAPLAVEQMPDHKNTRNQTRNNVVSFGHSSGRNHIHYNLLVFRRKMSWVPTETALQAKRMRPFVLVLRGCWLVHMRACAVFASDLKKTRIRAKVDIILTEWSVIAMQPIGHHDFGEFTACRRFVQLKAALVIEPKFHRTVLDVIFEIFSYGLPFRLNGMHNKHAPALVDCWEREEHRLWLLTPIPGTERFLMTRAPNVVVVVVATLVEILRWRLEANSVLNCSFPLLDACMPFGLMRFVQEKKKNNNNNNRQITRNWQIWIERENEKGQALARKKKQHHK